MISNDNTQMNAPQNRAVAPILVVDDAPENVYMLSALLRGHGYSVVEAKDGAEALSLAHKTTLSLIITDILMPVMDGFQLCKEWKNDPELTQIPFVFYSATYTEASDEKYALSIGADRFLRKPVEPDAIIRIVDDFLLSGNRSTQSVSSREIVEDEYASIVFRKLEKKVKELELAKKALENEIVQREEVELQRRQLESQLRLSQKTEAIGVLTSGLTHDFNNILHGIIGCAELLKSTVRTDNGSTADTGYSERNGEKNLKLVNVILDAAERGSTLIQNILTASRTTEQEMKPQNPFQTVSDALALLQQSLPRHIRIRDQLEPDCMEILMDTSQIHQVVMNLCINASHAMPEGGDLYLSLGNVDVSPQMAESVSELCPGMYVALRVADTGTGIPEEVIARIFEPYFTTKRATQGTGLGLSVVKGIVKNHSATIQVESALAEGTAFTIYFPPAEPADTDNEPRRPGKDWTPSAVRILLVDDSGQNLRIEQTSLESLGYSVAVSSSADEACRIFSEVEDGFDVVLYNQTTPDFTGMALTRSLRELNADIPIIICVGTRSATLRLEAMQSGIDLILTKPVSLKRYAAAIERVLASRH
jgi:signal transduction histidine kinase